MQLFLYLQWSNIKKFQLNTQMFHIFEYIISDDLTVMKAGNIVNRINETTLDNMN